MYEDRYGTDWERLTVEECLDRAFALGVLSVVESPRTEEYERLLTVADNAYGSGLIEMSYREGRARARELRSNGLGSEAVWAVAVDEDEGATGSDESSGPTDERPPAALDRPSLFDRPSDDSRERLSIPEFLRRRD